MTKALALTTLALALVPASAHADEATFKVSLYGVQRFEKISHEQEDPAAEQSCSDARGDVRDTTVVKFHTTKPVKMRVSSYAGGLSLSALRPSDDIHDFPLDAQWTHDGTYQRETKSCSAIDKGWVLDPPPLVGPSCSNRIDWVGMDVTGTGPGGGLEAAGGSGTVRPLNNPFDGCPYGDLSMTMYTAKGRIRPSLLLDSRETEVILRGRDRTNDERPDGDYVKTSKKTTVYVTFKKVGK